eukprot:TRINITY_DN6698_c0_g1_i1.p2 TRINITY_DN6698_c0_g1~~TRINITY_DN6698_c0_g1_i1.p2  ORF type:complete len:159 (+),score=6.67 TRINITY_DN6698_c0_g1_i1:182-658(+)
MQTDMTRVERLFREATEAGISIQKRSLTWKDIRDFLLDGTCLAIVLVDKRYLRQPPAPSCCCGLVNTSYTGHYILVCGFDEATHSFVTQDPAVANGRKLICASHFDMARITFGTDEDVLIVSKAKMMSLPRRASGPVLPYPMPGHAACSGPDALIESH